MRSGGGGSVAQIGRSKVSGYSVTPARLMGSSCMRKSAQATWRMLPFGIVLTSQMRAAPSQDAVTTRAPSGLKAAEWTCPSCPASVARARPEVASHTRAVPS